MKNFRTFAVSYGAICGTRHVESVFALSLIGKCGNFQNVRTTNSTHSDIVLLGISSADYTRGSVSNAGVLG